MKLKKYIFLGLLLYTLPVLAFGDFSSIYQYLFLPVILFTLYWRMASLTNCMTYRPGTYQSKKNSMRTFINGAILGFSLQLYGLTPFYSHVNNSIVELSFTYSNVLGYWVSFLSYFYMYEIYKVKFRENQLQEFNYNWTKIEREQRINSILSKWGN